MEKIKSLCISKNIKYIDYTTNLHPTYKKGKINFYVFDRIERNILKPQNNKTIFLINLVELKEINIGLYYHLYSAYKQITSKDDFNNCIMLLNIFNIILVSKNNEVIENDIDEFMNKLVDESHPNYFMTPPNELKVLHIIP